MKFSSHHSQDTNKNWSPNSKSPNPRAEVETMQERQRLLLRMDSGLLLQVTASPARHGTPTKESRYPHNDTAPPPQSYGTLSKAWLLQQVTVPPRKATVPSQNRRQQAQEGCNPKTPRQGCKNQTELRPHCFRRLHAEVVTRECHNNRICKCKWGGGFFK